MTTTTTDLDVARGLQRRLRDLEAYLELEGMPAIRRLRDQDPQSMWGYVLDLLDGYEALRVLEICKTGASELDGLLSAPTARLRIKP